MSESCLQVVPKLYKSCLQVVPKLYKSCYKVVPMLSPTCSKVVQKFSPWWLGIRGQRLNSGAAFISDDLVVFALPHVLIFPRDALAWPAPLGSPPSWRSCSKVVTKLFQTCTKVVSKLFQSCVLIFPRDALAWPAPQGSPPSWRSATPRRHTWVRCLRPPAPRGASFFYFLLFAGV